MSQNKPNFKAVLQQIDWQSNGYLKVVPTHWKEATEQMCHFFLQENFLEAKKHATIIYDEAKEMFTKTRMIGWRAVKNEFRACFVCASLVLANCKMPTSTKYSSQFVLQLHDEAFLECGSDDFLMDHTLQVAELLHQEMISKYGAPTVDMGQLQEPIPLTLSDEREEVPIVTSWEQLQQAMEQQRPAVWRNAMPWSGIELWKDVNYILSKAAYRTVNVELGMLSTDNFDRVQMTLYQFVNEYIVNQQNHTAKVGYIAYHRMLKQMPCLNADYQPAPALLTSSTYSITSCNCWMGPANTVMPLHLDQHENLFVHVVGHKYVRLHDKKDTPILYKTNGLFSYIKNVFETEPHFPTYKQSKFMEILVHPGDLLYIPTFWWHHVISQSAYSFSVNYFFTKCQP